MFKTVTIPPKGRVNFHANLFVKGMVIPIIVILLSVMIVFIFSYSRTLSSHNLQMKRVQLGVMCSHLAVGCANVVAQLMDKETSS
ncbi:hypothetical protein HYY75_03885, partial [bacterium]|nr:hypothetical protein [bacterium]